VYRERLIAYFSAHEAALDADSRRRLHANPLRILDSKSAETQRVVEGAPLLADCLDAESADHFARLRGHLDNAGIEYHVNPRLVRGLDYYTRTVFEWITDQLGSQATVCAGGRYDGLIAQLGGTPTPGIGWAMGQERIVLLLEKRAAEHRRDRPQVYLVSVGERTDILGLQLAERLRDSWPGLRLQFNLGGGNFKTQFKRADKSGARYALVLGEDEAARGIVAIKNLREEQAQEECPIDRVAERLGVLLSLNAGSTG
jgi:histidyl-tRNA synthetase